jgi:uncharacterized protein YukE
MTCGDDEGRRPRVQRQVSGIHGNCNGRASTVSGEHMVSWAVSMSECAHALQCGGGQTPNTF